MNNHSRLRSESTCEFLCFQHCNRDKFPESQQTELSNLKFSKLSLKKVMEDDAKTHKLKKSISDKNLVNKFRCETSRSHNEAKQLMLFKKKQKIENEIEKVDQQMSRLTMKYEKNICQLRQIKKQLEKLKKQ